MRHNEGIPTVSNVTAQENAKGFACSMLGTKEFFVQTNGTLVLMN
jgi:hypothetical protein